MEKQWIWVFEWRKSVHYWWSYILFSPECNELTSRLDPLLYRWGVPPVVIRCVHWTMQMGVLPTWIMAQSTAIVMRTSVSETKEAVYRPMHGVSRGVEQTWGGKLVPAPHLHVGQGTVYREVRLCDVCGWSVDRPIHWVWDWVIKSWLGHLNDNHHYHPFFGLGCCPPIQWGWQPQATWNSGSPSVSVLYPYLCR